MPIIPQVDTTGAGCCSAEACGHPIKISGERGQDGWYRAECAKCGYCHVFTNGEGLPPGFVAIDTTWGDFAERLGVLLDEQNSQYSSPRPSRLRLLSPASASHHRQPYPPMAPRHLATPATTVPRSRSAPSPRPFESLLTVAARRAQEREQAAITTPPRVHASHQQSNKRPRHNNPAESELNGSKRRKEPNTSNTGVQLSASPRPFYEIRLDRDSPRPPSPLLNPPPPLPGSTAIWPNTMYVIDMAVGFRKMDETRPESCETLSGFQERFRKAFPAQGVPSLWEYNIAITRWNLSHPDCIRLKEEMLDAGRTSQGHWAKFVDQSNTIL
ncbi:hypothetical protein BKA70DRAFT_1437403 [Coprinopsis sp. MPI-PUGE-AT-0042]|nr:hypothetical protein BKA70DRAFT_1437403 [Coprinopsis sp. MPI-PUGE-AT-0042]